MVNTMSNVLDFTYTRKSEKFRKLEEAFATRSKIGISGLIPPSKPFFISLILKSLPLPLILVTPTLEKAESFYENLFLFFPQSHRELLEIFPEKDEWDEKIAQSPRLKVLQKLSQKEPLFIISSLGAILQRIQDEESLRQQILFLKVREIRPPEKVVNTLIDRGYERTPLVEKRGEFSLRGCILDIFPITGEPTRLEYWGDEIESMRTFDINTQRSIGEKSSLHILPAKDISTTTSILEYLPESSWILVDEPSHIRLQALEFEEHKEQIAWEDMEKFFTTRKIITLSSWTEEDIHFNTSVIEPFYGKIEDFIRYLKTVQGKSMRTLIISSQTSRLKEIFQEHEVMSVLENSTPGRGDICMLHGSLNEGFSFEPDITIISDGEIFGSVRRIRSIKSEKKQIPLRLEDLSAGTYVVHLLHGIGIYRGLETLKINNTWKEFICVEYKKGDKLYVPIEQMDLIQKFDYIEHKKVQLSRLGGREWIQTRSRVKAGVKEVARKLLDLYARRDTARGFAFSPDSPWQAELEDSFPYDETPDQMKAILEVKKDMESHKPMDRLICGDAGYGKTEVALRSSFKAVMDGKQVALLVPTTILAEQHYYTFCERVASFPIKVEMLSRFKSPGEQKKIVEKLKEGKVDIIIGTHRLLQDDIEFKDLGLVIIDEEQHFGVIHKEKLKELRNHVDVITLSSTPIPRTLYLTISGIRDMSIITTPPENRLAVKTYLFEYQKDIIRGAIMRELERGGQVYFIHNRVRGIEHMAHTIGKLVPGARVTFAHGQMSEERLERIMGEFLDGDHDVLVCTTIIESGIDMPNVNTIIINNAYGFGLAQLYQLRGRVGRSHRQAYAYLLYPPQRRLGEMARRRMEILKDFSDLGAGFHIAMKDLELRGAGNILGTEQHGFVSEVGFDLYCQLLEEAIREIKGEPEKQDYHPPQIDLPLSAYLPAEYIPDDRQKLTLYKRMATISKKDEIRALEEELKDRFGPLPKEAQNLIKLLELRESLYQSAITKMKYENDNVVLYMPLSANLMPETLRNVRKTLEMPVEQKGRRLIIHGILQAPDWITYLERVLAMLTADLFRPYSPR